MTTRIALVTGCRSGFGLAIAIDLAKAGFKVYAGLRDPSTGLTLVAAAAGLAVVLVALDVTVAAERERVVADLVRAEGRLDVLVNNAGVALDGPLELISEAALRKVFEVNVFGAWAMTQACLPTMRAQRSGHVIMISSMSGRMAMPMMGGYAASKHALEGMSEAWRHELAPLGVQVVLVEPGPFKTDLFKDSAPAASDPGDYQGLITRFQTLSKSVFDKAGDPQAVAKLVTRLVRQQHPALRHPIGPTARLRTILKRVLPDSGLELIVRRVTRAK